MVRGPYSLPRQALQGSSQGRTACGLWEPPEQELQCGQKTGSPSHFFTAAETPGIQAALPSCESRTPPQSDQDVCASFSVWTVPWARNWKEKHTWPFLLILQACFLQLRQDRTVFLFPELLCPMHHQAWMPLFQLFSYKDIDKVGGVGRQPDATLSECLGCLFSFFFLLWFLFYINGLLSYRYL